MSFDFLSRFVTAYRNLSLKWKVPLRAVALVSLTALILSGTLIYQTLNQMKLQFETYAENMVRDFSSALSYPVLYRDTWKVYEFLTQITKSAIKNEKEGQAELIHYRNLLVLNPDLTVFASSEPQRYPLFSTPTDIPLLKQLKQLKEGDKRVLRFEDRDNAYLASPIVNMNQTTGYFVMVLDKTPLTLALYHYWRSALFIALIVLILIGMGAFYWAQKIARPLVGLSDCLGAKANSRFQLQNLCQIETDQDEVGQLIQSFQNLLIKIEQTAHFEHEAFHQERFAALGRMAAGVAHEVNNPLGGMLNLINNYRQHPHPDSAMQERTLALLERGLKQIQHTVSSLLVQAKYDQRGLTIQDFDDVLSLLARDIKAKQVSIDYQQRCTDNDLNSLPAHPVRQVLINLLLNAVKASPLNASVSFQAFCENEWVILEVSNLGEKISPDQLDKLFEPDFKAGDSKRQGFGLWICYQLVEQMGGGIEVYSEEQIRFCVKLPKNANPLRSENEKTA